MCNACCIDLQFIAPKGTILHDPVAALARASSAAGTKRKAKYQRPQLLGQDRHDIIDLSNQTAESAQAAASFYEHQV
jgi:hypothetical protein